MISSKKSGNKILVPELSEAKYFYINDAKEYIFNYQKVFLERLELELGNKNESINFI